MKKTTLNLLVLLFTFSSCKKIFLGKEEENSPENNFEIFWNDFDQHYSLFGVRNFNWDSIYTVYRPQVTNKTTDDELYNIFKNMISYLDDSHTFIIVNKNKYHVSGEEKYDQTEAEFSFNLLKEKYLDNLVEIPMEDIPQSPQYGKVRNKDIGYINLQYILTDNLSFMDDILKDIGKHKAIILDLRNNNGGSDVVAAEIAGRFVSTKKLLYTVEEKNGPNHQDFSSPIKYYSSQKGSEHFKKPVIVLTDRIVVSAAEILLLHLKSLDNVTQIGDTTAGDFSDTGMRRFLPNGWQYQYSIMKFLLPDGKSLDGIGHTPDLKIKNSESDIEAGSDLVLEEAIQYLFTEYGIE